MSEQKKNQIFGPFSRFFLFCAAADLDLLSKCPSSEHHKYTGVGVTVFFTGLLACASGGYALFTAFQSVALSVLLGILWGLLVFNLDRFLVSTMKKSKGKILELVQISPRLFLAVLLSLVISVPLELRIFKEEIDEQIYYAGTVKLDQLESVYNQRLEKRQKQVEAIRASLDKKQEQRDAFYQQYICECDGTCGTGQKGKGSECERKESRFRKSDEELSIARLQNESELARIREDQSQIQLQYRDERVKLQASFADGLLIRLNALEDLPSGPQLAIVLLLIAIEIAPILVKLLSPYGPYDHLLKTLEYEFEMDEIAAINMRNQQLNSKLTVMAGIEQSQLEQEIRNNEGTMKLIGEAHLELVREQLKLWLEEEKEKIGNSASGKI
ncbi:MAG: DUF4407 domain-containing protein [Cyclobacteriaceae bacterium]